MLDSLELSCDVLLAYKKFDFGPKKKHNFENSVFLHNTFSTSFGTVVVMKFRLWLIGSAVSLFS